MVARQQQVEVEVEEGEEEEGELQVQLWSDRAGEGQEGEEGHQAWQVLVEVGVEVGTALRWMVYQQYQPTGMTMMTRTVPPALVPSWWTSEVTIEAFEMPLVDSDWIRVGGEESCLHWSNPPMR